jgi:hypothetical protein
VTRVSWSRCGDEDCIRVAGPTPGTEVRVHPDAAQAVGGLPAMAGRTVLDGPDLCFVPRFAFVEGTPYSVSIDGITRATLVRPREDRPATAEVLAIYPSAPGVPRNLLRCYVWFSTPMSEGSAAGHLRLVDVSGEPLVGALLPTDYELWDAARRRLTVLLDPARIKRGLVSHRQAGYPLQRGRPFRLVVDAGFRDARGAPLRSPAERTYRVGADERRHLEPGQWTLQTPTARTTEPLVIGFDRPLDHGLLLRCLHVTGPTGPTGRAGRVVGHVEVGPAERSWRLVPAQPWGPGPHELVIEHMLEDVAGNSVSRVFDRDRSQPEDATRAKLPFVRIFMPR